MSWSWNEHRPTHPPATKCCHDFAGRRLEEDTGLLVVAGDGLIIVSMKSPSQGQSTTKVISFRLKAHEFFLAESRDSPCRINDVQIWREACLSSKSSRSLHFPMPDFLK